MKDYPAAVAARHDLIMRWLTDEGRLDVLTVAGRLGVAQETVRRDLRALESDGRLQRVHGGAVPVEANLFPGLAPPTITEPNDRALATRLWAELPRSGTILLGAGRLTLALTSVMISDPPTTRDLTVVTNSLDAAIAVARIPKLSVYNIGGAVSASTRAQEGDWALQELDRLHVDVSLICPAGISLGRGLAQPTPAAAAISRAEVACGQTVIALADASSLGRSAFVRFASIDQVDRVWLSGPASPQVVESFCERGTEVLVIDESVQVESVPVESVTADSVDGQTGWWPDLEPARTQA
jgi:DeoR family transcriptional regulator, fructose operon transcriptional repressor